MKIQTGYIYLIATSVVLLFFGAVYIFRPHSTIQQSPPLLNINNGITSGQNGQANQDATVIQENTDMEQKIRAILNDAYAHPPDNVYSAVGKTFPLNTLRGVKVTNQPSGGYDVHVDINLPDTTPARPLENYYGDESIVYVALYKNNTMGIGNISVSEYTTIQDQYGYTKTVPYVTTSLDSNLASKLNWKVSAVDGLLVLHYRCTGYYTSNCGDGMLPAVE